MCDPVSAAMMASAASGGFQAVGALREGGQQKAFYDAQAAQTEADAQAAEGMGNVNANIIRKAARLQTGAARAGAARSGVVVDAGSAQGAIDTINRESELDALTQLLTGRLTARRLNAQGSQQRIAGQVAMKNANWNAVGSLLGTGAKIGGMYADQQAAGKR
jgi:hypothetical protein